MHDLLEDDNDDMFYNVMDTRQNDQEVGVDRHRTQQLNTMELHGILGEHGYKLPELAGDQEEEEEESDGEEGAGDEDLDDPDVDDDEDDEDAKAIFKVGCQPSRGSDRCPKCGAYNACQLQRAVAADFIVLYLKQHGHDKVNVESTSEEEVLLPADHATWTQWGSRRR